MQAFQEFFFNDTQCFGIIRESRGILNWNELNELSDQYFDEDYGINYLKLIINYLPKSNIIFRVGGDGGRTYHSLQYFIPKKN